MPNSIKKERRAKRRKTGNLLSDCVFPFNDFEPNTVELDLDNIVIDATQTQIRDRTFDSTVRNYAIEMENDAIFPAVLVANLNGVYHLIDGFHRVEALRYLGINRVRARIIKVKSLDEARYEAVKANCSNGKPLTNKEKAKALDFYIHSGKHLTKNKQVKSFTEIANDLGFWSRPTVTSRIKENYPKLHEAILEKHSNKNTSYIVDYKNSNEWKDYNDEEIATTMKIISMIKDATQSSLSLSPENRNQFIAVLRECLKLSQGIETIDEYRANNERYTVSYEDIADNDF